VQAYRRLAFKQAMRPTDRCASDQEFTRARTAPKSLVPKMRAVCASAERFTEANVRGSNLACLSQLTMQR
jgi:hypothetical protein